MDLLHLERGEPLLEGVEPRLQAGVRTAEADGLHGLSLGVADHPEVYGFRIFCSFAFFMTEDAVGAGVKPVLLKNGHDMLGNQAKMKAGGFTFLGYGIKILELSPVHFLPRIKNGIWNFRKESFQTFVRGSLNSLTIP